jgi:HAD superfamily hydrolase (TIGR01509 family)
MCALPGSQCPVTLPACGAIIDTLLLDVDGVLQFPDPRFATAIERDYRWTSGFGAFQDELLHDPGEARALVGDGDLIDVVRRLLPRHTAGLSAERFLERWLADNIVLNEELLAILPRIAVGQIFLATNQETRRGARIKQLYADQPAVTAILISHELGSRKPHQAFFDAVLALAGRRNDQCLFVDDNPDYLDGATRAGIATIHYRTNTQLLADLTDRGLLPHR